MKQIEPDVGEEYLLEIAGQRLRPKDTINLSKYQIYHLQLWKKTLITSPYGMKRLRELYLRYKKENISFYHLHEDYGNNVNKEEAKNHGPHIEGVLGKFYRARSKERAREQIGNLKISTEFCHKLWREFPASRKSKSLIHSYNSMIRYRNRIVEGNYRLVHFVANSYSIQALASGSFDDFLQEGQVGLIRAAEKFDPYKKTTFSTYAIWWIKQALTKAVRKHIYTIIPPAHVYQIQGKLKKLRNILRKKYDREPTLEDLAEDLKMDVEVLSRTIDTINCAYNVSAIEDTPIHRDSIPRHYNLHRDSSPQHYKEPNPAMATLNDMIEELPPREKLIIEQRFGLKGSYDHTFDEIGDMLGITRERVRQIESELIEKFRKRLEKV